MREEESEPQFSAEIPQENTGVAAQPPQSERRQEAPMTFSEAASIFE